MDKTRADDYFDQSIEVDQKKLNLSTTADEKAEVFGLISEYKKENVPLLVPITLINHYVRKVGEQYLEKQFYLRPHPLELSLRNHA